MWGEGGWYSPLDSGLELVPGGLPAVQAEARLLESSVCVCVCVRVFVCVYTHTLSLSQFLSFSHPLTHSLTLSRSLSLSLSLSHTHTHTHTHTQTHKHTERGTIVIKHTRAEEADPRSRGPRLQHSL